MQQPAGCSLWLTIMVECSDESSGLTSTALSGHKTCRNMYKNILISSFDKGAILLGNQQYTLCSLHATTFLNFVCNRPGKKYTTHIRRSTKAPSSILLRRCQRLILLVFCGAAVPFVQDLAPRTGFDIGLCRVKVNLIRLRDVKDPTLSREWTHRWR
jgi:hypothetical protein